MQDQKKPRRSQRISSFKAEPDAATTPVNQDYLPTPLTERDSTFTNHPSHEKTATPPSKTTKPEPPEESQTTPVESTQPLSQFVYPPGAFADEEGVWGYLIPLDHRVENGLTLRSRDSCENREDERKSKNGGDGPEKTPEKGSGGDGKKEAPPGGYLVGRHPECGM